MTAFDMKDWMWKCLEANLALQYLKFDCRDEFYWSHLDDRHHDGAKITWP